MICFKTFMCSFIMWVFQLFVLLIHIYDQAIMRQLNRWKIQSCLFGLKEYKLIILFKHTKFVNNTTFMLFWFILGQRKTSLVVFLWKRKTSWVVFLATILFLMAYIRPLEIILAKKTTELVLLFHKKTTLLNFL